MKRAALFEHAGRGVQTHAEAGWHAHVARDAEEIGALVADVDAAWVLHGLWDRDAAAAVGAGCIRSRTHRRLEAAFAALAATEAMLVDVRRARIIRHRTDAFEPV